MNSSKKVFIYSIIFVITIFVVVTGLTYAFFTVSIISNTGQDNIAVHTVIGNCEDPVFTSYISKDLSLIIDTADMLENGNAIAGSDNANLYVKFIGSAAGSSGACSGSITCNYDLVWHDSGDKFIKSEAVPQNETEYSLVIGGAGSATRNIADLNDGDTILSNQTISSSGSLVTKNYTITTTMYNLGYAQDFYNKNYKHSITVENIICS